MHANLARGAHVDRADAVNLNLDKAVGAEMFRQAEESELDLDAMADDMDAFEEPEDD